MRPTILLLMLGVLLAAQEPVFSPPAGRARAAEAPRDEPRQRPQDTPAPAAVRDPIADLFSKLSRWPQSGAREAALVLSGLGKDVVPRLIAALQHNDWRVQSAAAWALGEMREQSAVQPLRLAIADPSNRAGLPDLMAALVRIDPQVGTAAVLPMLSHGSARVRQSAARALPPRLESEHLPTILALFQSKRSPARATALELLGRIPGGELRDEFFESLADPEAVVAATAVHHLGQLGVSAARTRLLELAANAPQRQAAHALLALVEDEDLHGGCRLALDATRKAALQNWLKGTDPFLRGTAAIVLTNVCWVSKDEADRRLADTSLVPLLIDAVAGGTFYPDYSTLEPLVWRKLQRLSGRSYGADALAWKRWWTSVGSSFRAERALASLEPGMESDLCLCLQRFRDGRMEWSLQLDAVAERALADGGTWLEPEALAEIVQMLRSQDLLGQRGLSADSTRTGTEWHVIVALPQMRARFERIEAPTPSSAVQALTECAERLAAERAWQQFLMGETPAAKAEALRTSSAKLQALSDRERRMEAIAELALGSFVSLDSRARVTAAGLLANMPEAWLNAAAGRIAQTALEAGLDGQGEKHLAVTAVVRASSKARQSLLAQAALVSGREGETLLQQLCEALPREELGLALASDAAPVRAAAAGALGRRGGEGAAERLIAGLRDDDGAVRAACLGALAALRDPRSPQLLEELVAGTDATLRVRAIGALGMVMGEQGVARAMQCWRDGGIAERAAVLKSLAAAAGPRAAEALHGIVREAGDLPQRREALEILAGIPDSATRVQDVLQHADHVELKLLAVSILQRSLGMSAKPMLLPWVAAAEPALARGAALALARLGCEEALQPLLTRLLLSPEGDEAAERALEALTFQAPRDASPPKRTEAFRQWSEVHGKALRQQWFCAAATDLGMPLDATVAWLEAREFSDPQLEAMVLLVERGTSPLRAEADRILARALGKDLSALPLRATDAEAGARAAQWRTHLMAR
jgi:HEAT repeat protein